MTPFDAIILGIVEGATEFLPISSTGHLILASSLLNITQTDFIKTFEIVIQLGSISAVVALYFRSFFDWVLLKKLAVAFIPTGIIGLTLYHFVKAYLIGNVWVVLVALFLGGLFLILFEVLDFAPAPEEPVDDISYFQAALIGLMQALALVPGISRSAATILGGLYLGVPRQTIVKFSFLLAVPTLLAASGYDLLKTSSQITGTEFGLLAIGFITAFIIAIFAMRFLLRYINENRALTNFGIYRILLAVVFFFFFIR